MEQKSDTPEGVVIPQVDQTEVHVQAVTLSGRPHVDIRLWRPRAAGYAPSRTALALEWEDLEALQTGVTNLRQASAEGRKVARIVADYGGRRLRMEIEPFGTRFVARLGFWQRVRSSWRPVDDGLVVDADLLVTLQDALQHFQPWLAPVRTDADTVPPLPPLVEGWPSPGADWLTVESERVAFHPKGIRLTATVERGPDPRFSIRQWRREESLWLPELVTCSLSHQDIEQVLACIRSLTSGPVETSGWHHEVTCSDELVLQLSTLRSEIGTIFRIERKGESGTELLLAMSVEHLSRFGRLLAEGWLLVVRRLPNEQRWELLGYDGEVGTPRDALGVAVEEVTADQTHPEDGAMAPLEVKEEPAAMVTAETALLAADHPDRELPPSPGPLEIPLGSIQLGRQQVSLTFRASDRPSFLFQWADQVFDLPIDHPEEMLGELRALYYDAMRGHRRTLVLCEAPQTHVAMHNRGLQIYCVLQQESNDRTTTLSFPASEVPTFLRSIELVLARTEAVS